MRGIVYATVDDLKAVLKNNYSVGEASNDDANLHIFAIQASRAFEKFCTNNTPPTRVFYPTIATRYFDHPKTSLNPDGTSQPATILRVHDDLLEVSGLVTQNGGITVDAADYDLMLARGNESGFYNHTPYNALVINGTGTQTVFEYATTKIKSNHVSATWGYHDNWSDAWEDSSDSVQDDPLSAAATTISVNDSDGADIVGVPVRFRAGQLLQIESEWVFLSSVDHTGNTLTVIRGILGTTAAEHAQNTAIHIYRPMADLVHAVQTLAIHMFRRPESIGTPDQRPLAAAKGLLVFPDSLPTEVKNLLMNYRKGVARLLK